MKHLPYFRFNGVSSIDEQLVITEKNVYRGASRDVSFTAVPGRNGDLLTDNRRYKNVKVEYGVTAMDGIFKIPEIAHRIKGWLLSEVGYFELADSYDPDYFRLAAYSDEYNLMQELESLGNSKIIFSCKPFRYLIDGQRPLVLTEAKTIRNPELFPASPYIKIVGSGDISLAINASTFVFKGVEGYIEIDSELMQAYKGAENQNAKMYTPTFPSLLRGNNSISWTGCVSCVEIVPRWCCL